MEEERRLERALLGILDLGRRAVVDWECGIFSFLSSLLRAGRLKLVICDD